MSRERKWNTCQSNQRSKQSDENMFVVFSTISALIKQQPVLIFLLVLEQKLLGHTSQSNCSSLLKAPLLRQRQLPDQRFETKNQRNRGNPSLCSGLPAVSRLGGPCRAKKTAGSAAYCLVILKHVHIFTNAHKQNIRLHIIYKSPLCSTCFF